MDIAGTRAGGSLLGLGCGAMSSVQRNEITLQRVFMRVRAAQQPRPLGADRSSLPGASHRIHLVPF